MESEGMMEQLSNTNFIDQYVAEHREELEALRAKVDALGFVGNWVIIGDKDYPQKRYQYATSSFTEQYVSPRIILYPVGDEDIFKAIKLCNGLKIAIAVRTGGHQYCGFSSTMPVNMQIDLSETYPEYDYDPQTNVLRCGVSHALGDWAKQNHQNNIYLPMGVCANVHLGGHVHTGGWGIVARSHGLLADHVLAFDIILASGEKRHIIRPQEGSTTSNNELYYAVLGGSKGGDFGIVTHWEFSPLRDQDYPNSACYSFAWLWSRGRMEGAVRQMQKLAQLCDDGTIPSDYEFMLNITGLGKMDLLSEDLKEALRNLGLIGSKEVTESVMSEALQSELQQLKFRMPKNMESFTEIEQSLLKERGVTNLQSQTSISDSLESLSEFDKDVLRELGLLDDGIWVPPMVQMWMCFTNKGGESEPFDDQWFESFTDEDVCGKLLLLHANRGKNTPVSKGLAKDFIMKQDREMQYPYVKRFRATNGLPSNYSKIYTERMYEIMGWFGTRHGQHLVSQQQIYSGGILAENGETGITSYSWREQALALSHDSFYSQNWLHPKAHEKAEEWQSQNDQFFIEQQAFADSDMRMMAYTFGNRVLDEVWPHYYDSQDKYERLKKTKKDVDPTGLFSADQFSL